MEDLFLSYWTILAVFFNRLLQSHSLLTAESRINGLSRFEQLMMNNSFPIPPNTQHHFPWRQYGLCNRLWSFSGLRPRSFSYIIVVRDPFFTGRNHSFQKLLDFVLFSSDSQMETRSIKFFTLNSRGTQVSRFFWYSVLCEWFKTVLWSMFSSIAMSQDEICRATSIFLRISSTFSTIGRPGRGSSLTSKFQEQKRANQFWHWRSVKYSSP